MSAVMFTACEKEEDSYKNLNTYKTKTDNNFQKRNIPTDTTYIEYSNFDTEFEVFVNDFFSNYPYGLINAELLVEINLYQIITQETAPIDPVSLKRVICRLGSDYVAMMNCLNRGRSSVGYDGCAFGYTVRSYRDGSGRVWYEGWVDC